jgi:hypothetical protein
VPSDAPFDPYEIGARNSDPELGALQPLPPAPPRIPPLKLLGLFAVGVVVVAMVKDGVGTPGPKVTRSCTTPAVTLSKDAVDQFDVVRWAATGPSGSTVLLSLDSPTAPATDDEHLLGRKALADCTASGQFGVRAPAGKHTVTTFLLRADGSVVTVATRDLTVTAP